MDHYKERVLNSLTLNFNLYIVTLAGWGQGLVGMWGTMVHILFSVQHKTCPKWVTGLKWEIFFISLNGEDIYGVLLNELRIMTLICYWIINSQSRVTLCTQCPTSNLAKTCSGGGSRDHRQLFQHMREYKNTKLQSIWQHLFFRVPVWCPNVKDMYLFYWSSLLCILMLDAVDVNND